MALRKKYTDKQYKKFLYTPMASSYGCSEDKILDYFFAHRPPIVANFGLTKSNMKTLYLPLVKKEIGKGAYTIFLGYVLAEGATGNIGWINNRSRYGSPYQQLEQDLALINSCLNNPHLYGLNQWAPETGVIPINATGKAIYNNLPKRSTGAMYMQLTLAGNASCWNTRAMNGGYYFGNPYDYIIDMIKACGGKPFSGVNDSGTGGDSGTGLEGLPKLPKKVYLNNSEFSVLGVKFKRYKNWLFIHYPFNVDGTYNGSEDNDTGDLSDKVKKEVAIVNSFGDRKFVYEQYRPAQNPNKVGWADCSGLVGWILHTVYPSMWNNGYINTGTILAYCRAHKMVVWSGSQEQFSRSEIKNIQAGDFIVMGNEPTCGAGDYSHVAFCYSGKGPSAKMISQEGPFGVRTTYKNTVNHFVNHWWYKSEHPYFNLCRTK